MQKFDFKELFIFEMANNHIGDLEHGKKIISGSHDKSVRVWNPATG